MEPYIFSKIDNIEIIGSKGKGGGAAYKPKTAKDSLNSKAYARIIDIIGEGEIEGFPSARNYVKGSSNYLTAMLKDIYFEKTPILRPDASDTSPSPSDYNFKNTDLDIRWGTQDQTYLPGFSAVESESFVNVEILKNNPIVRTITDVDTDRVRITLQINALQKITSKGDIKGSSISYKIEFSYNGGAYQSVVDNTISGRTSDPYQFSHVLPIDGTLPLSIRVSKLTDDSTDPKSQRSISWYSYTEIVDAKLRYPNTALVGIQVNAKDFESIPLRSYRVRGIRVSIPNNATVDQTNGRLIYSGIWDGTFKEATWCSDPAWCMWDLLTNCRYGFGEHIKSKNLDKWAFYSASVYCNELVESGLKNNDGTAIYEPRFSCNVSIQTQEEAYKLINNMCSVFRCMPYWSVGSLALAQDRPADAKFLFTQANVTQEGFVYNGTSLKSRHTVAVVKYLDLETQEMAYQAVEDAEAVERYGIVTIEIDAFACTSRTQAYRLGEWLIYTEQKETETVTFTTSLDSGYALRPGDVIAVSDITRSGLRRSGRISGYGDNFIIVDEGTVTDLPFSGSPKLIVGTEGGEVRTRTVTSVVGRKITVSESFSPLFDSRTDLIDDWGDIDGFPLQNGIFVYQNDDYAPSTWRVVGLKEEDESKYSVTALAYNASKYDYVERGKSLEVKTFKPLLSTQQLSAPTDVSITAAVYEQNGQLGETLIVSWAADPQAVSYEVSYRLVEAAV